MAKAWDILAPRPKIKHTVHQQKRRQNKNLPFLFFLIILGAIVIFFFGLEKPSPQLNSSSSVINTASPSTSGPKIKILNGTGDNEILTTIKKTLEDADFEITATENALNIYEDSIVYYNEGFKDEAQKIADVLSEYEVQIQKFSKKTNYDLLVVIGQK